MDFKLYQYLLGGLIVYLLFYLKRFWSVDRVFVTFVIVVAFFELIANVVAGFMYPYNVGMYNVYVLLCVTFYIYFLLKSIYERSDKIYLAKRLTFYWLCASVIFTFSFTRYRETVTPAYSAGMLITIALIVVYIYKFLYKNSFEILTSKPYLFFYFGILIFCSAAFPLIIFVNELMVSSFYKGLYSTMLQIGNVFLVLGYFATAICLKKAS